MSELRRIRIDNFVAPTTEHRITLVQLSVHLISSRSGGAPFTLESTPEHIAKIKSALTLALVQNWSGLIVLPEISTPVASARELVDVCCDLVRSRPQAAGGCVVMLPLEHVSLANLGSLVSDLAQAGRVALGDPPHGQTLLAEDIFHPVPPAERAQGFVNASLLLVIPSSGGDSEASLFVQPKLFPYPGERTPASAVFIPGRITYLLELGDTRMMGAICFDMIAQPPGMGLFLGGLVEEVQRRFGDLHYLLLPQCNPEPLDHSFQHALADLYHRAQVSSQTLRIVSPNVSTIVSTNAGTPAGHSWFVTCPFRSALPSLGIWERSLPSMVVDPDPTP